jgi:hypothetical protein
LQQEAGPGQPLERALGSGTLIQRLPREQLCWPNRPKPSHPIPSHPSKQARNEASKQTVRNGVACVACNSVLYCVWCACPRPSHSPSLPISSSTFPAPDAPLPSPPTLTPIHAHLKRRLQYSSNLFSSVLQLFLAGGLLLPSTKPSCACPATAISPS